MERQITTLAIIEDGDEVLLAMKKRGFGAGWWNGYGGKPEPCDRTIEDTMLRELTEESGLIAKKYVARAVIEFTFRDKNFQVEMHVFEVTEHEGEAVETEEMKPKWFKKSGIPFDQMWPADRDWMPMYFDGKSFDGRVVFDGETKAVIESQFTPR